MDRPTPANTEGTELQMEQYRHDLSVKTDVPAWHASGYGSAELGEFASRPVGVAATAAGPLTVASDGAHFPAVISALWGYRGQGQPYITLDLGGLNADGVGVQLRLDEAQRVIDHLQALVDAGRAGGAL